LAGRILTHRHDFRHATTHGFRRAVQLLAKALGRSMGEAGSLSKGWAIILLCGCADVTQCHRKLLADWLAHVWSADVVHLVPSKAEGLTPPDKNPHPGQQTLF